MNKNLKRIILMGSACSIFFYNSGTAFAAQQPSEKEEIVYAKLGTDGGVDGVYVVNQLQGKDILDYGEYESIRNMSSEDELEFNGNTISGTITGDQVYYEGVLSDTELPWDISIRYYLDGKEYSANEIAGKNGHLKINFSVVENEKCNSDFYDYYALQAAFTLDGNICKNIEAPDASIANAGADKRVTFTILPGKGIDTTIAADVMDFEMDEVNINGIKLNMNIDIDEDELTDKINELVDATQELNDGALDLSDGAMELRDGTGELKDGAKELNDGVASLDEGVVALQEGINAAQDGINTLNSKSEDLTSGSSKILDGLKKVQDGLGDVPDSSEDLTKLVNASDGIEEGIGNLYNGAVSIQEKLGYEQYRSTLSENGLNIDDIKSGNSSAAEMMSSQMDSISSAIERIKEKEDYESDELLVSQLEVLESQFDSLQSVVGVLNMNNAALGGTESYFNGISSGADGLVSGLSSLKDNYGTFDDSIDSLAGGLSDLSGNMSTLSSGIDELVSGYSDLDSGINEYTDGVAQLASGFGEIVDGAASLADGSKALVDGSNSLMDGTTELFDGANELYDGSVKLHDGTTQFYDSTSNADEDLHEKIDSIMDSMGGTEVEPVSFVSEKNTNIKSVQFVLKTEAIKIPEEAVIVQEEVKLTFWQKLKNLFKIG